ncbi:SgcJ/EcaC family oxidoreductase [Smaragdicoccus niigatensis]|uniref:SgcJ/EcaC family oxidoreductase n=1 Tax=Smaragdicoccus niigatensis TaxID=359359 RepID=UPI00039EE291|nr:SgcJ/EcaC family oxidoreductase [Smaragdicoccus niigatensis]
MTTVANPIDSLMSDMCDAWNRVDANGIAQCYTKHDEFIGPYGHHYASRAMIAREYEQLFQGMLANTTTTISIETVRQLACHLSLVDATQIITGFPPLHLTALVRSGKKSHIVESRLIAFLPKPV